MFISYSPKTSHDFKKLCLSLSLLGFFNAPLYSAHEDQPTNGKTSQAIDLLEYKYAMLQIQKESTQSDADKAPYLMTVGGICIMYWLHTIFNLGYKDIPTASEFGLSFISLMVGAMLTTRGYAAWILNAAAEETLPLIQKQIAILKETQSNKNW